MERDEWEYSIDSQYVEKTCVASLRLSDKCSANFNKPRGSSFAMQIYRVSQNKIGQVCKYLYEICLIAKKVY